MERYYFDSGVFITPILKNREQRIISACNKWMRLISEEKLFAFTSYLTWDELTYLVKKNCSAEIAASAGINFLNLKNLTFIDVEKSIIEKSQELFATYNIRPRDSIHAASAISFADSNIVTLDVNRSDFRKIKSSRGKTLLNIIEPKLSDSLWDSLADTGASASLASPI